MAKPKNQEEAKETLVPWEKDSNFAEPVQDAPRGSSVQSDIEAIRASRAAQRAAHGKAGKRRKITHYQDAERLRNLGLLTPEEHVDCEEDDLFFKPAMYATGTTAIDDSPPDEP